MYAIELNDEQLAMVAGGSTATAGAAGGQSTTISGSTISGGSLISSYQVVGAAANAHDITGSFNNNTLALQTASGASDTQTA